MALWAPFGCDVRLVLPDLTNPFFPELAQAVENKARSLGLLVCLIDSQGRAHSESEGFAMLMQHAVDGVIWCPLGSRVPDSLNNAACPVVLINRPRPEYSVVHSNYVLGGQLLSSSVIRSSAYMAGGGLQQIPVHDNAASQSRCGNGGATVASCWPLRASAEATKPQAFNSSIKLVRYFEPASRPFGVPIACSIAVKRPSMTRRPGWRWANATSGCFTPAAASSPWSRNNSIAPGEVSALTSWACFRDRLRK
jgi:hypothetical protein